MTTLDARARSASAALHRSVAAYRPAGTVGDVIRRHSRSRMLNYAGAAAVVALAVAAGALLRMATEEPEVANTLPPEPVVTTTLAVELDAPITKSEPPVDPQPVEEPQEEVAPPGQPGEGGVAVPGDSPDTEPSPAVDTEPPPIAITSPEDGERFETKTITFEGTTEPGAAVAAGRYEAEVDSEGHWKIVLVLSPGGNGATFTATDEAGNASQARITVYYDPPEPKEDPPPKDDPPPEEDPPPPEVPFTAHATYGSCSFDPPYDIYYGTADPATKITITSEYGGGSTTADAEGNWELQVFFPEAPHEEVFLVSVKDGQGGVKKFEFVSYVA